MTIVSAMPADTPPSPLDPVRILADLPESDRELFLAAYRQALADAADPEGFSELLRMLRLWWGHSLMAAQPGYAEAREAALTGTGTWMGSRSAAGGPPPEMSVHLLTVGAWKRCSPNCRCPASARSR